MKGKEQCDDEENEFGIAWIGNSTDLACNFSGAVNCGTIFISTSTYSAPDNEAPEPVKILKKHVESPFFRFYKVGILRHLRQCM